MGSFIKHATLEEEEDEEDGQEFVTFCDMEKGSTFCDLTQKFKKCWMILLCLWSMR